MSSNFIRVVDGNTHIGHLIRRYRTGDYAVGFEAYDLDDKSIGTFATEREGAEALWRHAHGGAP
jgi:hypothetical protein